MLYSQEKPREFNQVLSKHLAELEQSEPARMKLIDLEIFFNDFAPFYRCLEVYVVAALLGALSWVALAGVPWLPVRWSKPLRQAALAAMAVAFVVHTASGWWSAWCCKTVCSSS